MLVRPDILAIGTVLFEEPWHRPASAEKRQDPTLQNLNISTETLNGGKNDPLGVEPLVFTQPMDRWFGKRAMLSPGRRGRPRAVPT
jgi:hypothetical protein